VLQDKIGIKMAHTELGRKLAEIRNSRGLTQEDLAENTNISVRTIQRIENGEVKPRAYTLKILSAALGYDFLNINHKSSGDSVFVSIMHISNFLPIVIVPLIIWIWGKNKSEKIDQSGREVISYQILLLSLSIFYSIIIQSSITGVIFSSYENYWSFRIICTMLFVGLNTMFTIINLIWDLAGKKIYYPSYNLIR
jgi:transcriptional regulator with XRE-family HTH domain